MGGVIVPSSPNIRSEEGPGAGPETLPWLHVTGARVTEEAIKLTPSVAGHAALFPVLRPITTVSDQELAGASPSWCPGIPPMVLPSSLPIASCVGSVWPLGPGHFRACWLDQSSCRWSKPAQGSTAQQSLDKPNPSFPPPNQKLLPRGFADRESLLGREGPGQPRGPTL